jgi:hypothetical protein
MKDFIGQELVEGDYVARNDSQNTTPQISQIVGRTPKKVKLMKLEDPTDITLKFPEDLIKVSALAVEQTNAEPAKDSLGKLLKIGDTVFTSDGEYIDPVICAIIGFAPRMVKLKTVYGKFSRSNSPYRLCSDVIKVDSKLITMHCLTKENTNV